MNKKGFTLVELLAVIIILAIISMIAVPSISTTILASRKSAYIEIAQGYVDSVTKAITSRKLKVLDDGSANYIPIDIINVEKGNFASPYSDWAVINQSVKYAAFDDNEALKCSGMGVNKISSEKGYKMFNPETGKNDTSKTYRIISQACIPKGKLHDAWVVVRFDKVKDKYVYYWTSRDTTGHSVQLTEITQLTEDSVKMSNTPRVKFVASTRIAVPNDGSSNVTFHVDELQAKAGADGVRVNLVLFDKYVYGGIGE